MDRDELHLADALRRRQPSALERLMDIHGNTVYGLVNRILSGAGRPEDVEECVSDVFMASWKRINEFDEKKGTLRTWLLIIAKYSALDARRKLLRIPEAEPFEGQAKSSKSVEETVLSKTASAEMLQLVNALPEPDRTIFYKRYYYYESVEQIARGLKLTGKAVENRLYRLRKMFRDKMSTGRLE